MRYEELNTKVGRTYRTASEAFRDADYATGLWRCETDFDRTKQYLGAIAVAVVSLGFIGLVVSIPLEAIAKVIL